MEEVDDAEEFAQEARVGVLVMLSLCAVHLGIRKYGAASGSKDCHIASESCACWQKASLSPCSSRAKVICRRKESQSKPEDL